MASDLGSFNEETQRARVASGFKGGEYFKNPMTHPAMSFVDGVPSEVAAKMQAGKVTQGTPTDPWGYRK